MLNQTFLTALQHEHNTASGNFDSSRWMFMGGAGGESADAQRKEHVEACNVDKKVGMPNHAVWSKLNSINYDLRKSSLAEMGMDTTWDTPPEDQGACG